jgi:drug/metabolite transporter (DMT)-like permease
MLKFKYDFFKSIQNLAILAIITATFLLAIRGILVKQAYIEKIAVMDLFFFRFLIALPLLWLFTIYKKQISFLLKLTKKQLIKCILAGFFGYYLATLSDFYSLKLIDASINRVILYSFPIYVLSWNALIRRQVPAKKYIITFILIEVSLFFLLGGFNFDQLQNNKIGGLLALIAAISYSLYVIINQEAGKEVGSILFTTIAVSFSFLFITLHYFTIFDVNQIYQISLKGWFIIIFMAIFCTFLPLLLISYSIRYIGATRMSLISMLGPVITTILAIVILDETLSLIQIIAILAVIITLYLIEKKK